MSSVRAKFTCSHIAETNYNSKTVHFHAVYGTEGENADYANATPSGNLSMNIDNDTKAAEFFQEGKSYYLTFDNVVVIS